MGGYLDLPELGAEGQAEVVSVDACPQIPPSPSPDCHVVTGRFTHESAQIIDLQIEGLPAPTGCTSNHPFWSEDRQDFVEAGDLNQGETLRTADERLVHVVSITQRKTPETVYNLEVDSEHVYYVSDAGVLVHNGCEIIGKPHGIPKHKTRLQQIANKMKATGKYTKVYLNRSLKTITGGTVLVTRRPDVTGVLKGSGKLNMIEVPRPGQTIPEMQIKIDSMKGALGNLVGPGSTPKPL